MNSAWLAFWDRPHFIYVNARHKDAHYRLIASEIAKAIAALGRAALARVLDYGCGEALRADLVASACGELLLSDAAPSVRAGLMARFGKTSNIRVLAPEDVEHLPKNSLDLIVLHSVLQYLDPEQTTRLFTLFHGLLRSDGVLLVSDVIPPGLALSTDVAALLRFAAANGFLFAAFAGLARTWFSDYRRLRAKVKLAQYSEPEMIEKLAAAGFTAQRTAKNIGHDPTRMTFVARKR